jgi:transposase
MACCFKEYNLDQALLLPPSMRDWLPEGDLAYFIIDVVEELDLSEIYRYYEVREEQGQKRAKANSGQPPFDPRMMTGLVLYAYCNGTPSSRRIARLCERDVGYRVITGDQQPNFRTISEFRRIHLEALKKLFVQVLKIARRAGLVKLGHVSLDGTKVKANASKHKAMSYARMQEKETEYEQKIKELLAEAEAVDGEEDRRYGRGKRGDELPKELAFQQQRLEKIRAAKKALEQEAMGEARAAGKLNEDGTPKPQKKGRPRKVEPGTPAPKKQYNFTDPDSHIMKMGNGSFDQAYNCQAAVDSQQQIIVACAATNAPNDKEQLQPMVKQVKQNLRRKPKQLSADSGYYSEENVKALRREKIDDYVCPDRLKHGEKPPPTRGRPPAGLSFIDQVRRKLRTKKGRLIYGLRKQLPEPVFGQMKRCRGLNQFLLRGDEKADAEWSLWCTTHNLMKMWAAASG